MVINPFKSEIMKKFRLLFVLFLLGIAIFNACSSDGDDGDGERPTDQKFQEIIDIATFHGNLNSKIVVVNTQGGPDTFLFEDDIRDIITSTQTSNALWVNVHQIQTKNPNQFAVSDITFEQAKQFDEQSVGYLKKVVEYFKTRDYSVYVLGISFGAFMTQELISDHGIDMADKYLIMVGRLDLEEATWRPYSEGSFTEYIYSSNGTFEIVEYEIGSNAYNRNTAKLAAGLGFNRYTNKLSSIENLSKITYVYGDRDEAVGILSAPEIQFLSGKGANVFLVEGANHTTAIDSGLVRLKPLFEIP